jgi:glycerol-3-phosphate dehydrogenase
MSKPVLILGAGINGAAIARELVLNRVPVVVVDTADIASGATSGSSRLIHGGLRYLEYGDFKLVRESVEERDRLLRLAPDFVRPLEISIPVQRRLGGWLSGVRRFFGGRAASKPGNRGLWLVRAGLWLYDRYAKSAALPKRLVQSTRGSDVPPLDERFRWLCSYWDAQIQFPERFVVALLTDARAIAEENDINFQVHTYHEARISGGRVDVVDNRRATDEPTASCKPSLIVNTTGAWVDRTLKALNIESSQLTAGTKGSHLLTFHEPLRRAIGDGGLYVEADDGRPVFVLPFGDGVLIGTTDIVFDQDPRTATATDEEIEYLLRAVNDVLPGFNLSRDDVEMHYAAVRPLPSSGNSAPGAISRDHRLEVHTDSPLPLFSVVGGKLTTCRALAEEVTDTILDQLERPRVADSRDRPLPDNSRTADTQLVIANEWVTTLEDLVERRLMLLYSAEFGRRQLRELAASLVEAQLLAPDLTEQEVDALVDRLASRYGKSVTDSQET